MFDSKISPNLWTVCDAFTVHGEICLTNYGLGLSYSTMVVHEQKHQKNRFFGMNIFSLFVSG